MNTLGIIGGMSPESTVSYYRDINRIINRAQGGNTSAPILLYSVEFETIAQCQRNGDWAQAGQILAAAARTLEQAGAQALILATNTMHKVAADIEQAVSVPLLHILDGTAAAVHAAGLQRVAVLGTRFTMRDNFYRDGLAQRGLTMLVPDETAQDEIHRIIFDELCIGDIRPDSRAYYQNIIRQLHQQGAQGVILGCTEIGLLLHPDDSPLPLFDTATLHARAAADYILSGKAA